MQDHKLIIYQTLVRLFGNKNTARLPYGTKDENGVGKFDDFDDTALRALKQFGYTHIWYTGVLEHALVTDYTAYGIRRDNPNVVKGRAGSPYAIKDFYDVNPDLATDVHARLAEFDELVRRTHRHGLKVIIDFVPNHVARQYFSDAKPAHVQDLGEGDNDSKAFDPQNNFYYCPDEPFVVPPHHSLPNEKDSMPYFEFPAKATGNDSFTAKPSVTDWYETVKLNYGVDYIDGHRKYFSPVPSTWLKMEEILLYWAARKVDAFRCDMVEMVPIEFWGWVIPRLKQRFPHLLFIAEVYNADLHHRYIYDAHFDYLYDKVVLYDTLRNILTHGHAASDINHCWNRLEGINNRMLRFLENHDEHRFAAPQFAGDAFAAVPAMTVSATLHAGPVMLYFGQELGEEGQDAEGYSSHDGKTTIFDYWSLASHQAWMNGGAFDGGGLNERQKQLQAFYRQLFLICREHAAIREGHFYDLLPENQGNRWFDTSKVYAYLRHKGESRMLIAVNFDKSQTKVSKIRISAQAFEKMGMARHQGYYAEELLYGGLALHFEPQVAQEEGLNVVLPPLSARIFDLRKG